MGFLGLFGRTPRSVSVARARELPAAGASLIDVRATGEWNAGHAATAVHLPLDTLEHQVRRVPKGAPALVVCRAGMRSRQAQAVLARHGIEAYSVSGGMLAWARAGERIVARGSKPGTVA